MANRFRWRQQYDTEDEAEADAQSLVVNNEPSMTQQHFTKDADINEIVRRFGVRDGSIPPAAMDPSFFGDFTDVQDFREALDNTRIAQERFDALPAELRNKFGNDPLALWTWVNDPANAEEAVKIGLLQRETVTPPAPPAPTPPPTAPGPGPAPVTPAGTTGVT